MMTALEAADILGVALRTMYDLAAPIGPIPCYRMGRRCIRFDEKDLREYLQSCRHTTIAPAITGDIRTTRVLKVSDPAYLNSFQKRGLGNRQKLSAKPKANPR